LRADTAGGTSVVDTEPLWWPPAKIVGRYLAPFLAAHVGLGPNLSESARSSAVEIEVELDPKGAPSWSSL
jgi:hypothetical protein